MNKKYVLLSIFLVAILATLNVTTVNSKISAPPVASAGDPFNSGATCAQSGCHAGPAQTPGANDLTLNIGTGQPTTALAGFHYVPGTLYNLAFSINLFATTNPYYGFQIVALDASNNKAGTMTVSNSATTQIVTHAATGTRQYMGHHNANNTHTWPFKWTAPAAGTGPVTFYYAYNICNASSATPNNPEGTIYHSSVTIQELSSGIADISDKVSELSIFPNPISSDFNISFDLKETEKVSAQLYSLDGRLVKELINEKTADGHFTQNSDAGGLSSGVYLIKLNVGDASVTKKILKQ